MTDSSRIPFADQIGRLTDIFEGCETIRNEGLKEQLEDLASKYQHMLHHETIRLSPMLENTYRPKLDSHLREFQSFIHENQGKKHSRGLGGLFGGGNKNKTVTVETLFARYQAFRKTIGLSGVSSTSDKAFSVFSGSSGPLIAPLQPQPYSSSPPYLNAPLPPEGSSPWGIPAPSFSYTNFDHSPHSPYPPSLGYPASVSYPPSTSPDSGLGPDTSSINSSLRQYDDPNALELGNLYSPVERQGTRSSGGSHARGFSFSTIPPRGGSLSQSQGQVSRLPPSDLVKNDRGFINAGTLEALARYYVECGRTHGQGNQIFKEVFAASHRAFHSSEDFVNLLAADLLNASSDDNPRRRLATCTAICTSLLSWMQGMLPEEEDLNALYNLERFAEEKMANIPDLQKVAEDIRQLCQTISQRAAMTHPTFESRYPVTHSSRPKTPSGHALAHALTLIQWDFYSSLSVQDIVSWLDSCTRLVNYRRTRHYENWMNFNERLTVWIKGDILNTKDYKSRVERLTFWIQCAEGCLSLGNAASMVTIVKVLNSEQMKSLRVSWSRLDKPDKRRWDNVRVDYRKHTDATRDTFGKTEPTGTLADENTPFIPSPDVHFDGLLDFYQDELRIVRRDQRSLLNFQRYYRGYKSAQILVSHQRIRPQIGQDAVRDSMKYIQDNLPPDSYIEIDARLKKYKLRSMSIGHEEESDFKSRRTQIVEAGIRMPTSRPSPASSSQTFIPDLTGNIEDVSKEPIVVAHNEVYSGKRKSTGEKVGLKAPRAVFRASPNGPPRASKELQREINNWVKLDHKYILPFLGTCVVNDKFFLVSPWADYGNAMDFIKDKPKANRLKIIRQVAEAVNYLHNLEPSLIHGDLKPQNVLISRTRKVLLCDFGLGMLDNATFTDTMVGGTPGFQAPEVQGGNARTTASDVWAFASMAFQIVVERPPPAFEPADTPQPSEEADLSRGMDEHLWSVLVRCWSHSPRDRPNSREIVEMITALL